MQPNDTPLPSRVEMACETCQAPFTAWRKDVLRGHARFCGRACFAASIKRRVARTCEHCGAHFEAVMAEVRRGHGRFCSPRCAYDHPIPRAKRPVIERFREKVAVVNDERSCWDWQAHLGVRDYGIFWSGDRNYRAHVMAWEMAAGVPVPDGMIVCHACDRPPCVRNDEAGIYVVRGVARPRFGHLWVGTPLDNAADRDEKGRGRFVGPGTPSHGSGHHSAHLTETQVAEIRARYANGGVTQPELAEYFGISQSVVSALLLRKIWKHVP